jgi:hypothetical protein
MQVLINLFCGATAVTLGGNAATGGNGLVDQVLLIQGEILPTLCITPSLSEIGTTITLTWIVPDPDGGGPCTPASDA